MFALETHHRLASLWNRSTTWGLATTSGQKLHRYRLVELEVRRLYHDAHTALAEDAIDAVLARENVSYLNHINPTAL